MSFALRKSTASQVVQFKMVDSTTGLKKTGLTIANTDIKLIFDGGTTQTSKNSGGATEIGSTGVYYMTLDATDTATLGKLRADIEVAGALPWFADFMVMTALTWDAFYAASGGSIFADIQTIKTQTVTCAAGVTVGAFVGNATAALAVDASGRVDLGKILGTASAGAVGYVGVDWGQVTNKTTTNALTGTTIAVTQKVDVDTIKTNPVVNGGTITFPTGATLASTTNITAGTITTVSGNVSGNVVGSVGSISGVTFPTNFSSLAIDSSGRVNAFMVGILTSTFTEGATGRIAAGFKQFLNVASPTSTMNEITLVDTVTTVTNQLTAAAIATGVWQDATGADFTTVSSIGKSLYTSGNAPGAASGLAIVGSNVGVATSVSGAVGSVTGNVGGNVVGSVGSVTAGVTVTTNNDKTGYSLTVTPPTAAAIATAVWTDTTGSDFTTTSSPGKIIVTQLGGAFTTTASSVFTVGALANAPTGGSAPTVGQIATAVWQDATGSDFTTTGSIGKSLGGAFTALGTSVYTTAALANAPSGGGNVTVGGYAAGQDPATLVLDVAAASHNTAGTIGAKINSAGGAADPLANAVPGTYVGGTAGYVLGHLDPTDVTVQLPVDPSGNIVLRVGDDYLLVTGNELPFNSTGIWPDLTGATIAFELWQPLQATALYSFAGVVLTPTGDQQVYVNLTRVQTATITPGQYSYRVQATLATTPTLGDINTLAFGICLVTRP